MDSETIELLLEIYDCLDNYVDVEDRDGPYGITQVPNEEMRLQAELRALLLKHGVDPDGH